MQNYIFWKLINKYVFDHHTETVSHHRTEHVCKESIKTKSKRLFQVKWIILNASLNVSNNKK